MQKKIKVKSIRRKSNNKSKTNNTKDKNKIKVKKNNNIKNKKLTITKKNKKRNNLLKLFSIISTAISSLFLLFLGFSEAMFLSSGICIFCVLPIIAGFLAFFGISVGIVQDYNIYFIFFGMLMGVITIYLLILKRKHNCKDGLCKAKSN